MGSMKLPPAAAALGTAVLVLVCACEPSPGSRAVVADSAGIRLVTNQLPAAEWTLGPSPVLSLGSVQGGGPEEFFDVRHVELLPDGGLAVVNSGTSEVRVFADDGRFVAAYGREGRGPEEFRDLRWVRAHGDSLLTYDAGNDRLSVWTLGGSYARSFRLEWFAGALFPVDAHESGILAVTARYMTDLKGSGLVVDTALVSRYDLAGGLVDSLARLPHNERVVQRQGDWQTTLGAPFSAAGQLVLHDDGFCYAFGPRAQVACFGPQGSVRSIARVATEPGAVTPDDIDRFWTERMSEDEGPRLAALRRMRDWMPFPDEFPAFAQLLTDDRGRIWARRYAGPRDGAESWLIFEGGVLTGALESPTGFRVLDVRDGRLAGVVTNDLGVEFVRVHRFVES